MRIGLLVVLVFAHFLGIAQNMEWTDRIGSNGNNYVFNIQVDSVTGDVYSVGRVKGSATFGELTNPTLLVDQGDRDLFLTKHDVDGNLLWAKRYGGLYTDYGASVELDDEHVYVTGYFTDTCYVDDDTLFSNGDQDAMLIKLNKLGSVIWAKSWGGEGNDRFVESEIVDDQIFLVGLFDDTINFDGIHLQNDIPLSWVLRESSFLLNIDTSGTVNWAEKQESTRGVRPLDLKVFDGFVYVVGNCYGNTYFDDISHLATNNSFYDQFLAKYKVNGTFTWCNLFGDAGSDTFNNLDIDESGQIIVCGFFKSNLTYGPDSYNAVGNQYPVVLSIDTAGTILNSFVPITTGAGDMDAITYLDGRIFCGGHYYDSLFVNNDTLLANGSSLHMMYFELDKNFNVIDYFPFGSSNHEHIRYMAPAPSGQIVMGGDFRGTLDFNGTSFTTLAGTYDGFTTSICPKLHNNVIMHDTVVCLGTELDIQIDNHTCNAYLGLDFMPETTITYNEQDSLGLVFSQAGMYNLELTNSNGCALDTVPLSEIEVLDLPTVTLSSNGELCDYDSVLVTAVGIFDSIYWSNGESDVNSVYSMTSGALIAEVFADENCVNSDTIQITMLDCSSLNEISNEVSSVIVRDSEIELISNLSLNGSNIAVYSISGQLIEGGNMINNMYFFSKSLSRGTYVVHLEKGDFSYIFKIIF